MALKHELNILRNRIRNLTSDNQIHKLPEECFFLNEDDIVCGQREFGDSRYPYSYDGMTLWLYSSGYIFFNESTFQVFPPVYEGRQPYVAFYLGVRKNDGTYFPYSINGVGKFAFEKGVTRHCVYTPSAGYYLLECEDGLFAAVQACLDKENRVCFSVYVENNGKEERDVYLSAFFNPLLRYADSEGFEDKWFKSCNVTETGFVFDSSLNFGNGIFAHKYLSVDSSYGGVEYNLEKTTSRADYAGCKVGALSCSESLIRGKLKECAATMFTDIAVAGDMAKFALKKDERFRANYILTIANEKPVCRIVTDEQVDGIKVQLDLDHQNFGENFKLKFNGIQAPLSDEVFNAFIKTVQRQVDFCGSGKDYAGSLLGVRDVFQSIEAMLLWNAAGARKKIIEALGFCGTNGRMPRQYSIPPAENVLPRLDMREFIDQGNWVFDAVYQYLSVTNDYTILDEECGYYNYADDNTVSFSQERDSVFLHLQRIMGYLLNCIDEETNCLRAMYGDWNDALDGLGVSLDKSKRFGSGVSVMATLHLTKNLREFAEICQKIGVGKQADEYLNFRERICRGLKKFAVVERGKDVKIVHGWGDKRSYLVGSFNDPDGKERDSLMAHAFWVVSGMLERFPEMKKAILSCFDRLNSKYGLLTFNPYFPEGMYGVGRISLLPEGTAENAAVYNHSSLFGAWALFMMSEEKFAWDLLYKALPLTHKNISVTPFVMNNSYVKNERFAMDGESMSDWHTGSSNVMIKVLARYACGIRPDLDGITIAPSRYMPANGFVLKTLVKGKEIEFIYRNSNKDKRAFMLNGVKHDAKDGALRLSNKDLEKLDKIFITME